jgi:peptidase inhibitor I78 family protein
MHVRALLLASVFVASSCLTIACRENDQNVTSPTPADAPSDSAGSSPAPAPPTSRTCDATKAQFAVGSRASDELLERARVAAQATVARFLRPNDIITMEYLASRLNLNLNERGVVVSTRCG